MTWRLTDLQWPALEMEIFYLQWGISYPAGLIIIDQHNQPGVNFNFNCHVVSSQVPKIRRGSGQLTILCHYNHLHLQPSPFADVCTFTTRSAATWGTQSTSIDQSLASRRNQDISPLRWMAGASFKHSKKMQTMTWSVLMYSELFSLPVSCFLGKPTFVKLKIFCEITSLNGDPPRPLFMKSQFFFNFF